MSNEAKVPTSAAPDGATTEGSGGASAELTVRRAGSDRFIALLDGREVGWATVATAPGVWEAYSTRVDPAYQGHGIAAALVEYLLATAQDEGVKVIGSCWYVDRLMRREAPRWDHLIWGASAPVPAESPSCAIAPIVLG